MRPRKKDRHLPACVHFRHGAYYLVKSGKWHPLGKDLRVALAEYGRRITEPKGGMVGLIETALHDLKPRVARNTWMQYQTAGRKLKHLFADLTPQQVLPKHVVQMKRMMRDKPNMANRCLSVLRQVFDYALEEQLVDSNPAVGIKRNLEAKRERLISKKEYRLIYKHAAPRLQVIMDLLYFTGQRVRDVLHIKNSDLLEDGLAFTQQKTGVKLIVRWTPELRDAVARAEALRDRPTPTLLHNRFGKVLDYSSIHLQWANATLAANVLDADLRDIRAMSGTATNEQGLDATKLLGHTSPTMTKRYLRGRKIPHVDGPSFGQSVDVGQKEE